MKTKLLGGNMAGNYEQVTRAYEEAFEHHILQEFEKLVFKLGVGEVMKRLGDSTVTDIYIYFNQERY